MGEGARPNLTFALPPLRNGPQGDAPRFARRNLRALVGNAVNAATQSVSQIPLRSIC